MTVIRGFNINEYAKVKLTEVGLAAWRAHAEKRRAQLPGAEDIFPLEPKTDADGYWRAQAWEIIQFIGPHIAMGFLPPVETTILLEFPEA